MNFYKDYTFVMRYRRDYSRITEKRREPAFGRFPASPLSLFFSPLVSGREKVRE